jgi:hypothetical protein
MLRRLRMGGWIVELPSNAYGRSMILGTGGTNQTYSKAQHGRSQK